MKRIIKNNTSLRLIAALVFCLTLIIGCATASAATVTKEIDLSGFDTVSIGGSWDVNIVQGAQYKIVVTAPAEYIDRLCTLDAGKLSVQSPNSGWSWLKFWDAASFNGRNKIQITAPDMKNIKLSGSITGIISGFKNQVLQIASSGSSDLSVTDCVVKKMSIDCSGSSDVAIAQSVLSNLAVDCAGSSKISAKTCTIDNLALDVTGSSRFTLNDGSVVNLSVKLFGSSNVLINKMNGGKMSGSMSGSSNLTYSGTISGYDIQSSGSSKVRSQ